VARAFLVGPIENVPPYVWDAVGRLPADEIFCGVRDPRVARRLLGLGAVPTAVGMAAAAASFPSVLAVLAADPRVPCDDRVWLSATPTSQRILQRVRPDAPPSPTFGTLVEGAALIDGGSSHFTALEAVRASLSSRWCRS